MPSKTEKQRKLFNIALAYKRGETKDISDMIKKIADSMSEEELEKFANEENNVNVIRESIERYKSPLNNPFRPLSKNFFKFYTEFKKYKHEHSLNEFEKELLETDIGEVGRYKGKRVALDLPFLDEAEYQGRDVELNKPKRDSSASSKKFYVYVKNDKGNVIKVRFGAKGGGQNLSVKLNDPEARKNFSKRHNCKDKKDKTTAGYWSCRINRYWKSLGGTKNYPGYW